MLGMGLPGIPELLIVGVIIMILVFACSGLPASFAAEIRGWFQNRCPVCQTYVSIRASFCPKCGCPLK